MVRGFARRHLAFAGLGVTWRRIAPAVGLFLLAPLVGEFLLGNKPITSLPQLIGLAPLYGGAQ